MLTTQRAFILYVMVLPERGNHVHQTNGGFVYLRLNTDCSPKVSERQQRKNLWCCLRILLHQSEDNYNKFDGTVQMNLSRDKVEIVNRFTIPDESPVGAECNWHQSTSITRISRSNCHINSYSGICVSVYKLCCYR